MHIAIVTAGGAGMFCGSCMHDNTWARSLMDVGEEVSLIPTYTPIRVDEQNESLEKVFFGGINVYLNQKVPGWRYLPRFLTHWLDHPRVISWATRRSVSNDASQLGALTLSMVRGELGPHRAAIRELDAYISDHLKPDVVIFSNALLVGAVHELKERFSGPIFCVLQGDDVFLDSLDPKYRNQVINLISERAQAFDGFLAHSHFYKEYMADYLNLPPEKFSVIPLGIDLTDHDGQPTSRNNPELTIGYFARIAPEKGLHHLVDAFAILKESLPEAKLKIGGFLGPQHQSYFQESLQRAEKYSGDITYIGSPETHQEKIAFLRCIDVLSVPTEFLEPKGLYVLEALANGTPVVQPRHGAFPELIDATQGGLLVEPKSPTSLADGLLKMDNAEQRLKFARQGWESVREKYGPTQMAKETILQLERYFSTARSNSRLDEVR